MFAANVTADGARRIRLRASLRLSQCDGGRRARARAGFVLMRQPAEGGAGAAGEEAEEEVGPPPRDGWPNQ